FASSARATDTRLTAPTAARPTVHLFNFIWFLRCSLFIYLALLSDRWRQKRFVSAPGLVHLGAKLGESPCFDNTNFGQRTPSPDTLALTGRSMARSISVNMM